MNELYNRTNIFEHQSIHYACHCPRLFGSVGGLFVPSSSACWLKNQSKVPQPTFTKAVRRGRKSSVMKENIPTNAVIRALDGGDSGSAEMLHFVASSLMRQIW